MEIIQFNHKTAANLLNKSTEEYWLDGRDAYIRVTDGSIMCIHELENSLYTYVSLDDRKEDNDHSSGLTDEQSIYYFTGDDRDEATITSRIVTLEFDCVKYYYHRQFNRVTRQYIPVIEFHYYEEGEEVARNDS